MVTRSLLLSLAGAVLVVAPLRAPDLPAQYLPVNGGSGGAPFTRSCGAGKVLTGLRYRTGLSIDAIGLLCRQVGADGSLGTESTVGTMAGGGGGTSGSTSCPAGSVVRLARIYYGTYVDGVLLHCMQWQKSTRSMGAVAAVRTFGRTAFNTGQTSQCEADTQPVVAIRGRAAGFVDALGIICDEP